MFRTSCRFASTAIDNEIRRQQWQRVNRLKRITYLSITGALSLTGGYYYYYYHYYRKPLAISTPVRKQNKNKPTIFESDQYKTQFKPNSLLLTDNDPKSKWFGVFNPHLNIPQNIRDIYVIPTNDQLDKVGYFINNRGDLYSWDHHNNINLILSNYNLQNIKYSNNQLYSLSNWDGNIYIFPISDPQLFERHLSKSKWPWSNNSIYDFCLQRLPMDKGKIIQFDTGKDHLLFVNDKGKAFGAITGHSLPDFSTLDPLGQANNGKNSPQKFQTNIAMDIPLLNNEIITTQSSTNKISPRFIAKVACGESHSLALTKDGGIFSFGNNKFGQLGHPIINFQNLNISYPKEIPSSCFKPYSLIEKPIDIFCMANTSFILLPGNILLSMGNGQSGQLGNKNVKTFQSDLTKVKLNDNSIIKKFVTNYQCNHALIIDQNKNIWSFGNNENGQLSIGNHYHQNKPIKIPTFFSIDSKIDNIKLLTTDSHSLLFINNCLPHNT